MVFNTLAYCLVCTFDDIPTADYPNAISSATDSAATFDVGDEVTFTCTGNLIANDAGTTMIVCTCGTGENPWSCDESAMACRPCKY